MSLRSYLIALVIAAVLPVVIFAGVMTTRSSRQQIVKQEHDLQRLADAISLSVDHEITGFFRTLEALSTAQVLDKPDLEQFHERSRRILEIRQEWEFISLTAPSGQQLVNTRVDPGTPLNNPPSPFIAELFRTRQPLVSSLFAGALVKRPLIAVGVPVVREGKVPYGLVVGASPALFTRLLAEQKLPAGWLAVIVDLNKKILARTQNIDNLLGQPSGPTLAAETRNRISGVFRGRTREGVLVATGFRRSELSGWTVAVGLPVDLLEAPATASSRYAAGGGVALLFIGILFALLLGRQIARPAARLSAAAEVLGRGKTPTVPPLHIKEMDQIGRALENSGRQRIESEAALRYSEASLVAAQAQAKLGSWEFDVANQTGRWSAEMYRLFDREPAAGTPTFEEFVRLVHPEDQERVREAYARTVHTGGKVEIEFRFPARDGSVRYYCGISNAAEREGSTVAVLAGTIQDITENKQVEAERLRLLNALESSLNEIYIFDAETLAFEFVNYGACRNLGYTFEQLRRMTVLDIKPEFTEASFRQLIAPLLRGRESVRVFYTEYLRSDYSRYPAEIHVQKLHEQGRVRLLAVAIDITERKVQEERIRQLNRTYAVLSDINQVIVRVRNPREFLPAACRIAVEKGGFRMAWIGRIDSQGCLDPVAQAGLDDGYIERLEITFDGPEHAATPKVATLRQGEHYVCNDIEHDLRMAPWRDEALSRGYRSAAAFPLKIGAEIVGTFNLYSGEAGFFTAEELDLFDELSADIGLALEMDRREHERIEAESALRDSERRFRQLTESIREVFWLGTPDMSRTIYISPGYETIWGRSCRSLYESPHDWLNAIHPDDREAVVQSALTERSADGHAREFRILRPDGSVRWIRDRVFPVLDESGEVHRIAGIAEDITEQKNAELRALTRQRELEQLHELAREINAIEYTGFDIDGFLSRVLDRLVELGSFDLGSIRTRTIPGTDNFTVVQRGYRNPERIQRAANLPSADSAEHVRARFRVMRTGEPRVVEDLQSVDGLTTLKAEGCRSAILVPLRHEEKMKGVLELATRSPRRFSPGETLFCKAVGEYLATAIEKYRLWGDLTAAKANLENQVANRTRELTEANRRLQELDQLKSEFLANMSHELRTPLNAIIGFSELMHDGKIGAPVSAEQKEYLGDILNSGKHLLQLINDVLDLSKVEAGRMEVLKSTFAIDEIIVELVQNIAPIMSVKGLKLVREIPTDLPPIATDRRKFLQILLNLASNAVKFTDRGEITVRCAVDAGRLCVSVSDTGVGLKPEDRQNLFQPFSQIDSSLRKRHEGTGLGLYLSQRLAALLGGSLSAESVYGKGSTFSLTLPLGA